MILNNPPKTTQDCGSGVENYYGSPYIGMSDEGDWYFILHDYSGCECVQVSEDFARAWIEEFGNEADTR